MSLLFLRLPQPNSLEIELKKKVYVNEKQSKNMKIIISSVSLNEFRKIQKNFMNCLRIQGEFKGLRRK